MKKYLFLLPLFCVLAGFSQSKKITDLVVASNVSGSDIMIVEQGGTTKQATLQSFLNLVPASGAGTTMEAFTQSLTVNGRKMSEVTQTGAITMTLAASGHTNNSKYTVFIDPSGQHPLTIDESKFFVRGVIDTSQYNILDVWYINATVKPYVEVINIPKFRQLGNVTGLSATAGASSIALTWTPVANATAYDIERSTTGDFSANNVLFNSIVGSYTDNAVSSSTTYYYRVKAKAYGYNPSLAYASASATMGVISGSGSGTWAYKTTNLTEENGGLRKISSTSVFDEFARSTATFGIGDRLVFGGVPNGESFIGLTTVLSPNDISTDNAFGIHVMGTTGAFYARENGSATDQDLGGAALANGYEYCLYNSGSVVLAQYRTTGGGQLDTMFTYTTTPGASYYAYFGAKDQNATLINISKE